MKWIQRILTITALIAFVYAGSRLFIIGYDYYENWRNMNEVQDIFNNELEQSGEESFGIRPQFDPLLAINNDIVGWITVDDTRIDYPILQSEDNEYYLTRNYKRKDTRAGSIFMDFRNDVSDESERNTILYGHRMKDGSMFAQLTKYLDKDFYMDHPTVYFDTLYAGYDLEVFSVYQTTTDFYYIETDFASNEQYLHFIDTLKGKSVHQTDVAIAENDRIVTLSTCDYSLDPTEGRLVVHAKVVERGE
ncbi:class B sortase [Cytobacillus horneckiae]|uniref:class B sortase n=1 Tax=Cytobacillus horneckiae TaxID=549687 RepID=UPI003D9A8163